MCQKKKVRARRINATAKITSNCLALEDDLGEVGEVGEVVVNSWGSWELGIIRSV